MQRLTHLWRVCSRQVTHHTVCADLWLHQVNPRAHTWCRTRFLSRARPPWLLFTSADCLIQAEVVAVIRMKLHSPLWCIVITQSDMDVHDYRAGPVQTLMISKTMPVFHRWNTLHSSTHHPAAQRDAFTSLLSLAMCEIDIWGFNMSCGIKECYSCQVCSFLVSCNTGTLSVLHVHFFHLRPFERALLLQTWAWCCRNLRNKFDKDWRGSLFSISVGFSHVISVFICSKCLQPHLKQTFLRLCF